jgi:hypothetical protein
MNVSNVDCCCKVESRADWLMPTPFLQILGIILEYTRFEVLHHFLAKDPIVRWWEYACCQICSLIEWARERQSYNGRTQKLGMAWNHREPSEAHNFLTWHEQSDNKSSHLTEPLLEQTVNQQDIQPVATYRSRHKTGGWHFDDFGIVSWSKSITGAIVCKLMGAKIVQ